MLNPIFYGSDNPIFYGSGPVLFRDGPLEKLWGGGGEGEFSSRRNFFLLSNCLYEFFLGHSMNIFLGLIGVHEFFFI